MRVRTFFFVGAGVLLLALSHRLGVKRAEGQANGQIECVGIGYTRPVAVVDRLYMELQADDQIHQLGPLIPGTERIIACGNYYVVLANGDILYLRGGPPWAWEYVASFPGSSTRTLGTTWGSMKTRYRK